MNKTILSTVNGYKLIVNDGMYYIEDEYDDVLDYMNTFVTAEQVCDELKRWRIECDADNKFMLEIENEFIKVLENIILISNLVV